MNDRPDAHVFDAGGQCFKVRPAAVAVKHDEGFDLRNVTEWWAMVQFPDGLIVPDEALRAGEDVLGKVFPEQVARLLLTAIRWVAPGDTLHVDFAPGVLGVFDSATTVFTDKGPVEAIGESAPKIIIDP